MGNLYSYMRISTDTERQNFARQEKALKKYAEEHGIEYLIEFTEEKSAKNFTDRKQFNKLDKLLQSGDTVVFKDLSRFTREAENGYKKYMEWLERGINIVFSGQSHHIKRLYPANDEYGGKSGFSYKDRYGRYYKAAFDCRA